MGWFDRLLVRLTIASPRFFIRWVSNRYIAGTSTTDAIKAIERLSEKGCCSTVDVLGEEVDDLQGTEYFQTVYQTMIEAIRDQKFDANLSIKPTAFGIHLDEAEGMNAIESLIRVADEAGLFVRLDMEDHHVTDVTIAVIDEMRSRGLFNVGTVLQSRLHRTLDDITALCERHGPDADIRLCKGVYLEPSEVAATDRKEITERLKSSITLALEGGAYTAIASHDDEVIDHALAELARLGMGPSISDPRTPAATAGPGKGPGYEFQMLLGVRGDLRKRLISAGHRVRIYVPFGEQWYEYSIRRLKENPTVARHIVKALLLPWTNRP